MTMTPFCIACILILENVIQDSGNTEKLHTPFILIGTNAQSFMKYLQFIGNITKRIL